MVKKVALVTGAGSGIGRAAAFTLATEGYSVGALGRSPSELDNLVQEITSSGNDAIKIEADISKGDQMRDAVDELIGRFGRLDLIVANAATACGRPSI